MDESERIAAYLVQTRELYASIGEFAVTFELVVHQMQGVIQTALMNNGLTNSKLATATTAGLTADPVLSIFRAVVVEVRGDAYDEAERKILDSITGRIRRLIESRNDVIHRTWFIGWGSQDAADFTVAEGVKAKNSAKGAEVRRLSYANEDFGVLSSTAHDLVAVLARVMVRVAKGWPLASHFDVTASGDAVPRSTS